MYLTWIFDWSNVFKKQSNSASSRSQNVFRKPVQLTWFYNTWPKCLRLFLFASYPVTSCSSAVPESINKKKNLTLEKVEFQFWAWLFADAHSLVQSIYRSVGRVLPAVFPPWADSPLIMQPGHVSYVTWPCRHRAQSGHQVHTGHQRTVAHAQNQSHNLSLPSSWDYRTAPPVPAIKLTSHEIYFTFFTKHNFLIMKTFSEIEAKSRKKESLLKKEVRKKKG